MFSLDVLVVSIDGPALSKLRLENDKIVNSFLGDWMKTCNLTPYQKLNLPLWAICNLFPDYLNFRRKVVFYSI